MEVVRVGLGKKADKATTRHSGSGIGAQKGPFSKDKGDDAFCKVPSKHSAIIIVGLGRCQFVWESRWPNGFFPLDRKRGVGGLSRTTGRWDLGPATIKKEDMASKKEKGDTQLGPFPNREGPFSCSGNAA